MRLNSYKKINDELIGLSTKSESAYHRISNAQFGCAVSNLEIAVSTF
ncbi:hypothetical protein [Pseudoalteromonas sp. 2CM36K]|nr:hypothetical protein [Pseudoalteromonas sp. 2CM36K]MCK8105106.1 hypothetical protein [Pseudoalteromonas sp. 2CM36K]